MDNYKKFNDVIKENNQNSQQDLLKVKYAPIVKKIYKFEVKCDEYNICNK